MSRTLRIFLTGAIGPIGLGLIPVACHRHAPVQRQPEVRREVKDTTRVVTIRDTGVRDTSVLVFFRDTAPSVVLSGRGRTFKLEASEERQALRTIIRKERELWRSSKPRDYRFLLRVGCFCTGTRGWLLMEVRSGQPLRAWDKTGRSAALTDWNTLSIDGLYDNLEHAADRDGQVQIAFDPRWHFPTYVGTNAARGPDSWGIIEARAFRPLR
jgi:hypothetical protein